MFVLGQPPYVSFDRFGAALYVPSSLDSLKTHSDLSQSDPFQSTTLRRF